MICEITGKLVIDLRTREWCKMPYHAHPNGCPNYGTRDTCPPRVPLVHDFFDLSKPHWLAIVKYDLAGHINKMKDKHPDWSDKQCRCCLYWQNTPRKELRQTAESFIQERNFQSNFSDNDEGVFDYALIPEAMGVNIFRTCRKVGVHLRKNPKDTVHKVALIGSIK